MKCTTCNEPIRTWLGTHVCPPRFLVWCPDPDAPFGHTESDAVVVYAVDAAAAAEKWVNDSDDESDLVTYGERWELHVRSLDDHGVGEVERYGVTAEATIDYHAEALPTERGPE